MSLKMLKDLSVERKRWPTCLDTFEGKQIKTFTGLKEMGGIGWPRLMAWTLR